MPRSRLLWVDGTAGAVAGVAVLALSDWLSPLEGVPRGVLQVTGVVNLLYGAYAFSLAARRSRPLRLVRRLAVANAAWAPVCLALAAAYRETLTPFGAVHLVGEAVFVGTPAAVEWRARHRHATDASPDAHL